MMSKNNNKKQSNDNIDMKSQIPLNKDNFSSDIDTKYLQSAILWRKAINEIEKEESLSEKSLSSVSNDELAIERSWKAFQNKKIEDSKKKETITSFKKPYIFAIAASVIGVVISIPIYQQYLKQPSYQQEYKTKSFIVYEAQTVDNPLQTGESLKKELEERGFSVELFNEDSVISLDISIEKKPNKEVIDYLKSKKIILKNNKAYLQFLPPSN